MRESDHDLLCPNRSDTGPAPCPWCYLIAKVRADERENGYDERIHAWESVAAHPALRPAYDMESALLPAVLARLTDLGDLERLILELKPEGRLRRIRRKVLALLDGEA